MMAVILLYLGIVDLILMFQDFESAFSVFLDISVGGGIIPFGMGG